MSANCATAGKLTATSANKGTLTTTEEKKTTFKTKMDQGLPITVQTGQNVPTKVFRKLLFSTFFQISIIFFLLGEIKGSAVKVQFRQS